MTKLVSLIFTLVFFVLTISVSRVSLVRGEDAAAVSVSGTDSAGETSAELSPSVLLESVVKGDVEGVDR
jgi:hypothetical protein